MSSTETLNNHSPSLIPFKPDANLIKSNWKSSLWGRKQIRILVGSTGELSIQTIAQNSLARLGSAFMKFISFGKFKSRGKKIISLTSTGYRLPSNLPASLSKPQEKKLFEIQNLRLTEFFLPSHKKLNALGASLCDQAIEAKGNQAIREKVLSMNQQILDFQHILYSELQQKDLHPAELYEKLKTFETASEEMCKQYPVVLAEFIAETKPSEQIRHANRPQQEKIEEMKENKELALQLLQNAIENPLPLPSTSHLTPQQKYETLLKFCHEYHADLRKRCQFLSADRLEKEIEKIKNQLEIESIRVLFSKNKKEALFKSAAEALEDALDTTNESIPYTEQLLALPIDSPHEQKLKEIIILNIRKTVENSISQLKEKKEQINNLPISSKESPWIISVNKMFENLSRTLTALAISHDGYESSIPGLQSPSDWILYCTGAKATRYPLEALDRKTLVKHKLFVDQSCKTATDLMEKETQKDPIEQLIALKNLSSPYYDELHSSLISKGNLQLQAYISTLENYQKMTLSSISLLPEKKNEIEAIETKIKEKLIQARSLTTDYFVRLHMWHLFCTKVPVKELRPEDLKKYLNEIDFLSRTGLDEVKQYAQEFGFEF